MLPCVQLCKGRIAIANVDESAGTPENGIGGDVRRKCPSFDCVINKINIITSIMAIYSLGPSRKALRFQIGIIFIVIAVLV